MLAAFQIFNRQPGPELFTTNSELVWPLTVALLVIALLALIVPHLRALMNRMRGAAGRRRLTFDSQD